MKKVQDNIKLTALEINQQNLMEQFKTMNQENKEQHAGIMEVIMRLEEKLDKALDKKANKWVERAVVGFIVMVLTGLASYIGALIYQTIIHVN